MHRVVGQGRNMTLPVPLGAHAAPMIEVGDFFNTEIIVVYGVTISAFQRRFHKSTDGHCCTGHGHFSGGKKWRELACRMPQ